MKNITLSIPDDLLAKSREYASKHGTSLNQFIRDLLNSIVIADSQKGTKSLFEHMDNASVKSNIKWTREELYER